MCGLGVVGLGSVFWGAVHVADRAPRAAGDAHVAAVYDATPTSAARPASGSASTRRWPARTTWSATRTSTLVLVLTQHERARAARARGAAGGQARAGREAGGDVARGGGRAGRAGGGRPRPPAAARRTSCSRPPTARCTRACAAGDIGAAALGARPLRLGGPGLGGAGSTSRAAARCSTSASTTSRACAASSGPARRVTAMTGVAIPERDHRRRDGAGRRPRTTRTC